MCSLSPGFCATGRSQRNMARPGNCLLSHEPCATPPLVLMRWMVVTSDNMPLPRRSVTSSLSNGMSFGVAPGTLAASLAFTPLLASAGQWRREPGHQLDQIGLPGDAGFCKQSPEMGLDSGSGNAEGSRHLRDTSYIDDSKQHAQLRWRQLVHRADNFGRRVDFQRRLANE